MLSNHLTLYCPLLLLTSIFPRIRDFSSEQALHIRWPKYQSFSFSISTYNEYSGLISFRIDWVNFLAVQGTLKSLLQHHSSKASNLQCSAFFTVRLSHPVVRDHWKNHSLTCLLKFTAFPAFSYLCVLSRLVVSYSLRHPGLWPSRLL